ncbi:Asp23/Gls24 family envelope stress response protein [Entomoplasma freundtii]|nr:Asp23/Gls24 family envelope stress response protein [Entomoplasma freundtii]
MKNIDKSIIKVIKEAVITVPGVSSFANYNPDDNHKLATANIDNAVEFMTTDDFTRFRIHVILISGVNIKDVINEVQIRVKYELEKMSNFAAKYLVDVVVDDMLLN